MAEAADASRYCRPPVSTRCEGCLLQAASPGSRPSLQQELNTVPVSRVAALACHTLRDQLLQGGG